MRKYTFDTLKGRLSSGKSVFVEKEEIEGRKKYTIYISFSRADIAYKEKYSKETYVLAIKKFDSQNVCPESSDFIINLRFEFNTLEEVLDYLEDHNYIKKSELIVSSESKQNVDR